jgi:hypothetical protein
MMEDERRTDWGDSKMIAHGCERSQTRQLEMTHNMNHHLGWHIAAAAGVGIHT